MGKHKVLFSPSLPLFLPHLVLCALPVRSFLYLLASKQFYDETISQEMSAVTREGLETTLTLNLFYLAQAYGFVGNTSLSALYCHMVNMFSCTDDWVFVMF